ncbi:MAG: hypothetical protein RI575_16290 [Balneolaceae bacterium]|nr:hypothetical protein [Balneolaceae bacterium]
MIFLITGITLFTLHFPHEHERKNPDSIDVTETGQILSADTDHCPACLFYLKTDLIETKYDGNPFYSFWEFNIPDEVFLSDLYEFIVKGRSPPTLI